MENVVSLELWEKLAKISPDMLCTFDAQGCFAAVSQASSDVLGYKPEELVGRSYEEVIHPDDLVETQQAVLQLAAGNIMKGFENRYVHKNGHVVYLHWSAAWSEEEWVFVCVARDITELTINRIRLRENDKRYQALFYNSPDIVFVQDGQGLVTEANHVFLNLIGTGKEEIIGKPLSASIPAEAAATSSAYLAQAMKGANVHFQLEIEKEGRKLVFDAQMIPIVFGNQTVEVQTVARDITPTIRYIETIYSQAEKLNAIFESITDAFVMIDREWCLTYINSEAERLVQLDRKLHLGKSIWHIYPEQLQGEFHSHYQHALETGKSVSFTAFLKEADAWLHVKAFPSADGLSIYFEDVTEHVVAQQELKKLSLVASKTDNSVVITDAFGRTEWVNEGFTKLTGYSLKEMSGKQPGSILRGPETDEESVKFLTESLVQGKRFSIELVNYKKSGEKYWVAMNITPVYNEEGVITQFISIQKDITFQKQAEKELLKLTQDLYRQNSDLQQFTYIVSHNLRAPVANAIGLANILTKADKESEKFDRTLSYLNQSVLRLDSVLRDMNTILSIRERKEHMEYGETGVLSVLEQVHHAFEDVLQSCGASVNLNISAEVTAKANRAYLYSIFHNLLSNAHKYRSEDRPLRVNIKHISSTGAGSLFSFSDNGIGFDMSSTGGELFKLYKRFHTDKKGRGVGLYLIKAHLEAMGGHVEVTSQVGVGTKFLIYLPI